LSESQERKGPTAESQEPTAEPRESTAEHQEPKGTTTESQDPRGSTTQPSPPGPKFIPIFLDVTAVLVVIFAAWLQSIGRSLGVLAIALALAVVLYHAIPIWRQRAVQLLLVSFAISLGALSVFLWLALPKDNGDHQLQAENQQLRTENAALKQRLAEQRLAELEAQKESREKLLVFAGEGIRETCDPVEDDRYVADELETISCSSSGVVYVYLNLYSDRDKMYRNYYEGRDTQKGIVSGGVENCRINKPGEGEWHYNNDKERPTAGRLFCAFEHESGNAWIEWTYEEHNIQLYATRDDKNIAALFNWWQSTWAGKS
jgi:hypothetical protein